MRHLNTLVTAAALAAATTALAACDDSRSAPEPENESVAAAMPETPDISDTANEATVRAPTPTPAGDAGTTTEPAGGQPEN